MNNCTNNMCEECARRMAYGTTPVERPSCPVQMCGATTVGAFPEKTSLAMAYIPFQMLESEDCLYCIDVALAKGTLFKELDKPWRGGCC